MDLASRYNSGNKLPILKVLFTFCLSKSLNNFMTKLAVTSLNKFCAKYRSRPNLVQAVSTCPCP
ncbi:hypothetical protein GUITHDRAFT_152792 [Guillardia theta CCMP2712]|uniref:Uncharacterized protein n=1 Tax=Guillardia theta (strain CCMP2712) TaxID=905079 RepID=L1J9X4_GUITC|nr:hypothetical protein GUITHDRAFT_152792 [Guillardia theta CCMP2712]EKX45306.1 hypothetical protein GUITHDRAFT_152792 [Guillardia theta CCMP2712]|eukprot:XP_005832286.1 hypothetical protein GUITHDRAFT_152792 [Guillardia theta CCMP2712]